jgi:hypothetical protein
MRREQLEHILRAAATILKQRDFLVVGSAAVLGTYDDKYLPEEAVWSDEGDLAPYDDPKGDKSTMIAGVLGQGSRFHDTFGYYADGVDFNTALVPPGWDKRLVLFEPAGARPGRGWCLDVHDLAAAKLAAGREKDFTFVGALLGAGFIDKATLASRLNAIPRDRVLPGFLAKAKAWLSKQ